MVTFDGNVFEFHSRLAWIVFGMMHLNQTDVSECTQNCTKEASHDWHPEPMVARTERDEKNIVIIENVLFG